MFDVKIIEDNNKIYIYNEGILIIEGNDKEEIKELVKLLFIDNNDSFEIELLNRILYTLNIDNLSTMEVA